METTLRQISDDIWASLGPGYSESVYHCAFEVALRKRGLHYETERIVPVFYEDQNVGHVRADLIVERKVVIELKSVGRLTDGYRIQTRNYLKLLDLDEGYLINFPDKNTPLEFEVITRFLSPPTEAPCISSPISDPVCTASPLISTTESKEDTHHDPATRTA